MARPKTATTETAPDAPTAASSAPAKKRKAAKSETASAKAGAKGTAAGKVPATFKTFIAKYPELGAAHEKVANAVERAGPLDAKTLALVKVGICIGAGLESALRSHVRRAMQHGASKQEIEQAILLGMNTVGFPRTVAAWAWAQEQFNR